MHDEGEEEEEEEEVELEGVGVSLGRTHHGFCLYYRSLVMLGLVEDLVKVWEEKEGEYVIFLTGHSLGIVCVCVYVYMCVCM